MRMHVGTGIVVVTKAVIMSMTAPLRCVIMIVASCVVMIVAGCVIMLVASCVTMLVASCVAMLVTSCVVLVAVLPVAPLLRKGCQGFRRVSHEPVVVLVHKHPTPRVQLHAVRDATCVAFPIALR
mmetsp:Transcript_43885/g.99224  ORF Transcript_43885/g.99224 Transcript_43885/m.99224 type:complete len:125 (+) Transcript_43885:120-494(+)